MNKWHSKLVAILAALVASCAPSTVPAQSYVAAATAAAMSKYPEPLSNTEITVVIISVVAGLGVLHWVINHLCDCGFRHTK